MFDRNFDGSVTKNVSIKAKMCLTNLKKLYG